MPQRDQARASVSLAEAEIEGAKLNLGYTTVTAPAAGVTALQSPPVGALIQAQQTLLTVITQLDPAYVNFSFTIGQVQAFRALNKRREKPITGNDLSVDLLHAPEAVYPRRGTIDTAAQRVDAADRNGPGARHLPESRTAPSCRASSSGCASAASRCRTPSSSRSQAVSQGPQGPSVYVVGANDVAEVRPIRLGPEVAAGWVVQEGLRRRRAGRRRRRDPRPPGTAGEAGAASPPDPSPHRRPKPPG